MNPSRTLALLRRVQAALDRGDKPTPLAVGLSETELQEMAEAGLLELWRVEGAPEDLTGYRISDLTDQALGILAASPHSHRVTVETPHRRPTVRILRALGIGIWDLAKIGAGCVLGWYLKKYFG